MKYWTIWILGTVIKGAVLTGCTVATIGGVSHPDYVLLAVMFIPLSLFFAADMVRQILLPLTGGKILDTPVFFGDWQSWRDYNRGAK